MKEEFEQLSKYLEKKLSIPNAGILDIGSATGELSIILSRMGFNVTGIDFSPLMLGKAIQKVNGLTNLPPKFILADINQKLPFNDNEFDLIICRHSFNAAMDKNKFITEIKRIVKSSGLIFTAGKFPCAGRKRKLNKGFALYLLRLIKPIIFRNNHELIGRQEIINLFEQAGFKLREEKLTDRNFSLLFVSS